MCDDNQSKHLSARHHQLVMDLAKPGDEILSSLTSEKCHLWHMASCVPGEAGELFDAVKKHVIYGRAVDLNNVIEELGDLEFYLEGVRQHFGIDRETTLAHNIGKLTKRYGERYSDKAAQDRVDKADEHDKTTGDQTDLQNESGRG